MSRCPDCGCSMSGGFCPNCHEEVFIVEQYSDLDMELPELIAKKASEQINDKERQDNAKKIREQEAQKRRQEHYDFYGEYPE